MRIPQWIVSLLADRLIARAKRTPYYHLAGYMNRWWLVPYTVAGSAGRPGDGTGPVAFLRRPIAWVFQRLGIGVRVHEILRSDDERAMHNHPWGYASIILKGGYMECTPGGVGGTDCFAYYPPGSVIFRRAKSRHRLMLVTACGAPATTLFVTGPWQQRWGFFVNSRFVPHAEYRASQERRK